MPNITTVIIAVFVLLGFGCHVFVGLYGAHHKAMTSTNEQDNSGGDDKGSHKGFKYNRFSHNSPSVGIETTTDQ